MKLRQRQCQRLVTKGKNEHVDSMRVSLVCIRKTEETLIKTTLYIALVEFNPFAFVAFVLGLVSTARVFNFPWVAHQEGRDFVQHSLLLCIASFMVCTVVLVNLVLPFFGWEYWD